jgi:hypothetical protein
VAVSNVLVQVNGAGWNNAVPGANGWSNWTAAVSLTPGTNVLQACAVDTSGNVSKTNTVSFVYVLSAELTVNVGSGGTVTPNDNGALLQIGQIYSLTAKTNAGFAFAGWTGSLATNKLTLTFVMASNLVFDANFADVQPPVVKITNVVSGLVVTNANFVVRGTAVDNAAVSNVLVQVNGAGWNNAAPGPNGWSNWTAAVSLTLGTNVLQAYAVDTSGNNSPTNTVRIVYVSHLAHLLSQSAANGWLQLQLIAPALTTNVLESSPDLIHWTPVQTNVVPASGLSPLSVAMTNRPPVQFFRVR